MHYVRRLISVLGLAVAAAIAIPTAVSAQAYPGGVTEERPPAVLGETEDRPSTPPAVQGTVETRGETLPLTGGDVVGLTVIGAGLVAGGAVLVRRSRRTSPAIA